MNDKKIFQEKIKEHEGADISAEKQKMLNSPIAHEAGLSEDDQEFMRKVLGIIDDGDIDLSKPSSLLNEAEYEKLSPENKAKVEMRARIILHDVRRMKDLHDSPDYETNSYQMEALVSQIRQSVNALEDVEGDVLKI